MGWVSFPSSGSKTYPARRQQADPSDGACTFRAAIETQIEIDYQLSQAGRGLKYSSDPTLLIKEPATTDSEIVKGAGNALVVSEKGDAKLLEIGVLRRRRSSNMCGRCESLRWRVSTATEPAPIALRRLSPVVLWS